MSTEFAVDMDAPDETPPPIIETVGNAIDEPAGDKKPDVATAAAKTDPKTDPKPDDGKKTKKLKANQIIDPQTAELRSLIKAEDMTVKEIVEQLGTEGSYTIKITRKDPEYARDATGKSVLTRGYLDTVERKIDEQMIQQKYGGGTYELTFRKKNGPYITHRTITIAGDPNVTDLPGRPGGLASVAAPPAPSESSSMVGKAIDLMSKQLEKAEDRAERASGSGRSDDVVEFLRDELRASREAAAEQARRFEAQLAAATRPPEPSAEEKVKDRWLDKLMDQDSARLTAQRSQFESEIRMLKEHALDNERRLRDQFERDRTDQRTAHEREIALLRQSHETALSSARASFETQMTAAANSFTTQREITAAENRRLERELTEQREDLKELRAKKDKSVVEQFKEIQTIKEAIGIEDGDDDKGMAERLIEAITNPEAIAAVGKLVGKEPKEAAPPAPPPEAPKPRVIRDAEGKRFILSADGKTMKPVRPKETPGSAPGEPPLPYIDPDTITLVVGYLERAFSAGTDPTIVAQSGKAQVPEPVLAAIRDLGGVDAFLSKVAKLPSSSPLTSTQSGRNWVRKVGKALVGE